MDAPIYLDHAATTPTDPAVVAAMSETALSAFGNPSSTHLFGDAPRRLLADAREFLRGTLGAAQVVFTSGGTEADWLGIVGAVWRRPPGRVLVGAADHPAVLALEPVLRKLNHRLVQVPTTGDGDIDPERLFDLLGADVRALAILHGHNELGTLAQVDEIVELVRRTAPGAHVHVDLVQAYGKVPFDLDLADVDSVAVSAHKLHGPRGVGMLALSSKAEVTPLIEGGGQEGGMRGGTENVAGAVGLARAAELAFSHLAHAGAHMRALADRVVDALDEVTDGGVEVLGHRERRLPHVLGLRIPGIVGATLQQRMSARGVAFSIGAACHGAGGGEAARSHVHAAIGLSKRASREVVRLSFSRSTTVAEVERAIDVLCDEIDALRAIAPERLRSAER